ncbi:phage head closure protein [Lactiplantibacillus plantarum]|uniref:phage head closure protein n=1 Tax=Lactiplantibacillus plantarum TaxID=1590 RepID=UPI001BAD2A86|nr:phage head closure protein [Lactiplantibacillus plantarum]MBS0937045.1 phage head closure protein [Lactiplantibacillus plantarum]MBS0945145.1 phage head closure protein [Lactiplantibacillus plantarum]
MALNKLTSASFNRKLQVGTTKTVQNPINGTSKQTFVVTTRLWCAPYTRSIASSYQLTAEQLDEVVVVIRHNSTVKEGIKCQYQGNLYSVVNDSMDDSNSYLAYDYLTLKLVTKEA